MNIDFATLQGLTIPEGVVTQIAKDGVVLWSAIKPMVTITIDTPPLMYSTHNQEYARITINGVVYDGSELGEKIQVEVGTIIECYIYATNNNGDISINGTEVLNGISGTYAYTVTSDCVISFGCFVLMSQYQGRIKIIEIPEGCISFKINREIDSTYVCEDGMTWGEWVNSKYNINGYKIGSDNYVYTFNEAFMVISPGHGTSTRPKRDTEIIANITYDTEKA